MPQGRFINSKYSLCRGCLVMSDEVKKVRILKEIPFFGEHGDSLQSRLRKVTLRDFPQFFLLLIKLREVFTHPNQMFIKIFWIGLGICRGFSLLKVLIF